MLSSFLLLSLQTFAYRGHAKVGGKLLRVLVFKKGQGRGSPAPYCAVSGLQCGVLLKFNKVLCKTIERRENIARDSIQVMLQVK